MAEGTEFGETLIGVDIDNRIDPRARSIAEKRAIGLTHDQIAELHGVSAKTVYRTLKEPEVNNLVLTLQSEIYSESTAHLLGLLGEAVNTLQHLMDAESDSVRLRAASKVIDMAGPLVAHRAREEQFTKLVEAIEARIEEL